MRGRSVQGGGERRRRRREICGDGDGGDGQRGGGQWKDGESAGDDGRYAVMEMRATEMRFEWIRWPAVEIRGRK
jgi:hypothetical protein